MSEAEKILEKFAKKNMILWNQNSFKRTHTLLHKSIIEAINEALNLPNNVEEREQLVSRNITVSLFCRCSQAKGRDSDEEGRHYCIECQKLIDESQTL